MTTSIAHTTSFVAEAEFRPDDSPEASMFTKRTLERTGFGAKEITFFGSVALLLNNITGAPIVDLPGLFQQAGWVTPIAMMIFMVILSVQSSSMLCEAMAAMPNNARFQRRIEMSSLSKHYLPTWAYWLTQLLLNISLIVMNMSCIIVAAQSMDWLLLRTSSWVGALEMYPHFRFIALSTVDGSHVSPFDGMVVVSIGFVIVMIISAPLGYWNLDENMWIQNVAFVVTVAILMLWTVLFCIVGFVWSRIPAFGPDQTQVLGNMIFNYAFVTTVPSWVNEKKERVSINKSLWISVSLTTLLYILVGITGGLALAITGDEDVLDALPDETKGIVQVISAVSCYAFPFIVLLPGIPVYSIIVRYNLLDAKVCGQGWANFWGVIFPWIISIFFCTGSGFTLVVNWTSLFVNGAINFLIPLYIYIEMKRRAARAGLSAAAQVSIQADDESRFAREASTVTSSLLNIPPADPHDPFPCFATPWYHKRLSRYLPFNPVYIAWFLFTLTAELIVVVIVLNVVAVFH